MNDAGGYVAAEGVQQRLRALNRAGYTYAQLNLRLGKPLRSSYARSLATAHHQTVPAAVAGTVFAIPWPDDGRPRWRWWDQAACRGLPLMLFFPTPGNDADPEALATCARCPVRLPCLEEALADPDEVSVRGGTTREQRGRLRRSGTG